MRKISRQTIKRYIHSSLITFLAVFIPLLAHYLQTFKFEDLEKAGIVGAVMVLARLLVKVLYESGVILLVMIAKKLKK